MIKCQGEGLLSSKVSLDHFVSYHFPGCRKYQVEDSIFLEPLVWQWHPTSSFLISLNSTIYHICCLTFSTEPLESKNDDVVELSQKPALKHFLQIKWASFYLFHLCYRTTGFLFPWNAGTGSQLQHWALKWLKLFSNEILSRALWKSVDRLRYCLLVAIPADPLPTTPTLRLDRKCLARCHRLPSSPTSCPGNPIPLYGFNLCSGRLAATTPKSYYDPVKSSLWFPVFVCVIFFLLLFNQGLLANKEPNVDFFTHSLLRIQSEG